MVESAVKAIVASVVAAHGGQALEKHLKLMKE
jgi:hypothetical protein